MKNLMMTILLSLSAMVSMNVSAATTLMREPFLDECVETIYTTDPLINLAIAMGRGMGPGVKGEIRQMCGCYADNIDERIQSGTYSNQFLEWHMGNLFYFFQSRNIAGVNSGVRVKVLNDVKECSPHMLR